MSKMNEPSQQAVHQLLQSTEDQLYEQLGIRARAIAMDTSSAGSFEPSVIYEGAAMGPLDDVREFGKRLFRRWNNEAYKLVCGDEAEDKGDREKLLNAFGLGDVAVAGALSGLLVANLGLSPALAAVIAAIVLKRFFRPGYVEFCKLWQSKLPHES